MGKKISYWVNGFVALALLVGAGAFFLGTLAQNPEPAPVNSLIQPLLLTEQSSTYNLTPHVRLFEDTQNDLSFQKVYARYKSGAGKKIDQDNIFLGYTSSAYWIVFTVENRDPVQNRWVLDLGTRTTGTAGAADRLSFFSDANPDQPLVMDGRRVKNKMQMPDQEKNAIPLTLEPQQARTFALYIKPTPGVSLVLTPQLEDQPLYQEISEGIAFKNNALLAAVTLLIGILLLFLWRYAYAIPACLIAYTAAQFLIFRGADEIVSQGNNTGVVYLDVLHAVAALAALLLTKQFFFSGRSPHTVLPRLLTLAMTVIAFVTALGFGPDSVAGMTSPLLLHFLPITLPAFIFFACAAATLKQPSPPALMYSLAWLVLFSGSILTESSLTGSMELSALNINLYWLSFALHLALLSVASLRFTVASGRPQQQDQTEILLRQKQEIDFLKNKEKNDQAELQIVIKHEKELIADLKKCEASHLEALSEAKKIAEDATKARTDFLAIVSHEIRTPMTGIMGMIRLLTDTPLNEKQKEYVDTLQYSCNALLALINDILDFSKVGVKKMDIETINFDLGRLIEGVIPLMSSRADEKKIALKTDVDPQTPRLLKGDPTRIRQILLNLIGNSIKFTDKGSVTLIVKPVGRDENGRHKIYFGVKDTGIGMSPEVQKTVFVPYAQGHASIARRFGGTGLGLSISQQLTAAMGGMVEMTSALGAGTTFFFTLAFEEGTAIEEDTAAAHIEAIPIKVLVVDDNLINQKVVAGLLEKDKHTIVTVGGARAALDEIAKTTFDVILMDMEMPDIDGPEATRMIRALPDKEKAAIPIVAMTSNTSPDDLNICFKAGMNASCSKPVNLEQLRALLLQVAKKEGPFSGLSAVTAPAPAADAPAPKSAEAPAFKPTAALFDPETLSTLKSSMNKAQLDDMMKGFYDKTEELIADAEKAVADKDLKAAAGRGHDIKGMTANFGLLGLSEVGAQLDRLAKGNASSEALAQVIKQLRPVYADTRKTIDEWMKS
jgi:signal transduction histidine kinase/CheY-like chemotaxis protein/HPt (histidine-containing phosphotransfer) domain-containing protein